MTGQQVRIGIVVEGDTERRLFEDHRPWFQSQGLEVKVVQANGRPRLIQEARSHLEAMRLKRCRYVFFLLDQHDDSCPPVVAALLQEVRRESDAVVCVIARALEAWFLADTSAVHQATGQRFAGVPTDELDRPAERLKGLFRQNRHQFLTKIEMVRAISPYFDFERAAQGNRSAHRFLRKLSEAVHGSSGVAQ
jgi:hypothetical protein